MSRQPKVACSRCGGRFHGLTPCPVPPPAPNMAFDVHVQQYGPEWCATACAAAGGVIIGSADTPAAALEALARELREDTVRVPSMIRIQE